MRGSSWDMDSKLEAAIAWLMTGSFDSASKLCNIPARTIRDWSQSAWWEDVLADANSKKQKELDACWTGLIHDATSSLRDMVQNGEAVLTKNGNVKRVPIKARDMATIINMAVEKRALSRGQATSRTEKITVEQRLDKIKKTMNEEGAIINEKQEEIEHGTIQ